MLERVFRLLQDLFELASVGRAGAENHRKRDSMSTHEILIGKGSNDLTSCGKFGWKVLVVVQSSVSRRVPASQLRAIMKDS
jgi:hypothetical protein